MRNSSRFISMVVCSTQSMAWVSCVQSNSSCGTCGRQRPSLRADGDPGTLFSISLSRNGLLSPCAHRNSAHWDLKLGDRGINSGAQHWNLVVLWDLPHMILLRAYSIPQKAGAHKYFHTCEGFAETAPLISKTVQPPRAAVAATMAA